MFDARCRPMRRLFCLPAAMIVSGAMVISAFALSASGLRQPAAEGSGMRTSRLRARRSELLARRALPAPLPALPQSGPAMTTVSDTVYRADGQTAQGTLIITWPAFVTASGAAVAAGVTNATLGANGALSVALVPNAGASPAGAYFTVVYQLGPAEVRTEFWIVPTTSPANLAMVRTTPGTGTAAQPVSMQYVDGTVDCLNASTWTKASKPPVISPQP